MTETEVPNRGENGADNKTIQRYTELPLGEHQKLEIDFSPGDVLLFGSNPSIDDIEDTRLRNHIKDIGYTCIILKPTDKCPINLPSTAFIYSTDTTATTIDDINEMAYVVQVGGPVLQWEYIETGRESTKSNKEIPHYYSLAYQARYAARGRFTASGSDLTFATPLADAPNWVYRHHLRVGATQGPRANRQITKLFYFSHLQKAENTDPT